ncbi:MAG: phosphoribosylglycinamide formyltransferase [Beijerinckiaceae bacterium]
MPPRVAVLISGRGSNMSALIAASRFEQYPATISLVISNRLEAPGVALAQEAGVKSAVIVGRSFPDRLSYDKALDETLRSANISIICLAGFMRILTPWFVGRWLGKIINIHPSILPAYKGLNTHERALQDCVRIHGCSTHFVTPELDAGPIIMQAAVAVAPDDTIETLAARVLEREHAIYPLSLSLVASGAAMLKEGKCVIRGAKPREGSLIAPAF